MHIPIVGAGTGGIALAVLEAEDLFRMTQELTLGWQYASVSE